MTLHTVTNNAASENAPLKTMNVLVLDDSEVDRQSILRLLEKAGLNSTITQADTLESFAQALDYTAFDLIFIDYLLGPNTGLEAVDIVMKHSDQATAASIMIAGEGQIDIAVDAMRRGCADYLMKSMLTVASLQKSIATAIERKAVMAQFAEARETRRDLEASVRRYADASTAEMRNLLSATLRRVRLMRRHKAGPEFVRDLSTLELDIDRLWESLPKFRDQVAKELTKTNPTKALH
jgi:DNA-binding NtrC family response regulator